ncbi:MAG: hypothetical protein U1F53_07805 [Burkholderiaceae bacterium]
MPSLDADAPKASLEMAVSRLRKLLTCPRPCWWSTAPYRRPRRWCGATPSPSSPWPTSLRLDLAHGPAAAAVAERAERLPGLYRDRLLGRDSLVGGMQLARERLALRYLATAA